MRIVVDTNIVFSAVLNTNSQIAGILLLSNPSLLFYSTAQLYSELNSHWDKLLRLSGYNDFELNRLIDLITKKIRFINISLIPNEIYRVANELTFDVDADDTEFVALTEFLDGKLWTGDKKLQKGLIQKKWNRFVNTDEILSIM
jgi:predicted nucleic acid-binding protein